MIFGFLKKLIKHYIDKLVHWLRVKKLKPLQKIDPDDENAWFWQLLEQRNREYIEWETKGKWEQ